MIRAGYAFILFLPATAVAQAPPTLAEYLKANPIAGGLAVGAEGVRAKVAGAGLGRYERKTMTVGEISAIVPLTMVRIDDSLKQAPNLYDGLPRDEKVLYLMTTLSSGQWRLAGGKRGIGLGDLSGEQRNVFLSILPKPLRWEKHRVGPRRLHGDKIAEGALDEKESQGVRLRIERSMRFLVPLAERDNSYTFRSSTDEAGQPGDVVALRNDVEDRNPKDSYGVEVRSVVPNALKKGQLDTSRLTATVTVPARTTVGNVLSQVGSTAGIEILADARVRDLSVSFPTGKARAGDLLDALALAVTGTYRKVSGAYVLAADVAGLGARKLKLTLWKEEIDLATYRQTEEWRRALATSGLVEAAKFDPANPLSPSPELQKRLSRSPYETDRDLFFSSEELSSDQRAFLDRRAALSPQQVVRRDKVGVSSILQYGFNLPDGTRLRNEGYMGEDWQFTDHPAPRAIGPDPAVAVVTNPDGAYRPLAVSLKNAQDAARAVATAKAFGFSELWVQTSRPEVLTAAIAGGLPVRLFARPWAIEEARPDSDRTLLGDSGRAVAAKLAVSQSWAQVTRMVRMQGWPRLGPITVDGDLLSPLDPQWPTIRNTLVALGRTPGLAGVVLTDAMPHGYEVGDPGMQVGSYSRTNNEFWAFGYDERMRLAFLRAKGIDPVDLSTDALRFEVDLYSPFFPRYPAAPASNVDEARSEWLKFRSGTNAAALNDLRAALPDVPFHIDVRRALTALPPLHAATLRLWAPGTALPFYTEQYIVPQEGDIRLASAPGPKMSEALADFINAVKVFAQRKDIVAPAVDLTRIPPAQWEEVLAKSFTRK
ncbi:MAG: hypothetical protein ACO1SV_27780 [Fimbriimonas sp.]